MCTSAQEEIERLYSINALTPLLADRTSGKNIIWATQAYSHLGEEYGKTGQITPSLLLTPPFRLESRAEKERQAQSERTKSHAEVFTPLWVVQKMNNYIEDIWFSAPGAFNAPRVQFPKGKSWQSFVCSTRLEITCGEAPYLTTRYDVSTGKFIPMHQRVGILDRKLRVVSENTSTEQDWLTWGYRACESVYGYDFQGDNVLLSRLNIFLTFKDYMLTALGREPNAEECLKLLTIASWNIWQMDGTTGMLPYCRTEQLSLLTEDSPSPPCRVFNWIKKQAIPYNKLKESAMKFDFIIGNPPYQEDVQNKGDRPNPIYDKFIDGAYAVSDVTMLIHPARFLFNAGQTSKVWNQKMLSDEHLKVIMYEPNASNIFPNTDIKGGVAITLHNLNEVYGAIGTFTPHEELNTITKKVSKKTTVFLDSIVSSRGMYRFTNKFFTDYPYASENVGAGTGNMIVSNIFEKMSEVFSYDNNDACSKVCIIGRINNKREKRYILSDYVVDNDYIGKYNVILAEANGTGKFGETLSLPTVLYPSEGATDTFISIGKFDTEDEALSLIKYIKTKLLRAMLGVNKATQHNPKSVWRAIPLQDFTPSSDIDWTKSIAEIDAQLYKKYGLDDAEVAFIESHVKEMN